jgi:alkylated DNA repair dioxygenase AlkB
LDLRHFPNDGRHSKSYGLQYNLETSQFDHCEPIPRALMPLCQMAADFVGEDVTNFTELLLIRYDEGARIDWHIDKPLFDHVVGLSLGGPAVMNFRKETSEGFEYADLFLEPRSIYLLADEARHAFQHSIAPMQAKRWSVTIRSLANDAAGAAVS